jgi:hypothetical protein
LSDEHAFALSDDAFSFAALSAAADLAAPSYSFFSLL